MRNDLGVFFRSMRADLGGSAFPFVWVPELTLSKNGLHGQAPASIDSLDKAKAVSGLGRAGVKQYESLYDQRAAASTRAGATLGNAVYGAQIAESNKHLVTLNSQVKTLTAEVKHLKTELKGHPERTGHTVAHVLDHAAAKGKRRANRAK